MSNNLDVKSVWTAETAGFDRNLSKSGDVADRTAAKVERASARMRAAWDRELLAQDRAADSAERAARKKELASLQADIVARSLEREETAQARVVMGLERWVRTVDASAASATRAAAAHRMLADQQERSSHGGEGFGGNRTAASAVVRGIETGNPGIRAVEATLTRLVGSGVLNAAFSVIGPIAFAAAVLKGAEALYEMEQKAAHAGEATKKAFAELNGELREHNLELSVASDKVEEENAKLSKKPGDGLRTALDEAALAAMRLGDKLDKDIDKVKELLEKNKVGFFGGLASGTAETKDTANLVLWAKGEIDKTRHEYDAVVQNARDSGNAENLHQAEQARLVALEKVYGDMDNRLKLAQDAATRVQGVRGTSATAFGNKVSETASGLTFGSDKDHGADISILQGGRDMFLQEQGEIGGDYRAAHDEQTHKKLEGLKSGEDAARKAEEAAHKAAEARMKGYDNQFGILEHSHQLRINEVVLFWERMEAAEKRGSENWQKINEKVGGLLQERDKQTATERARDAEESSRAVGEGAKGVVGMKDALAKVQARQADGIAKMAEANAENAIALREVMTAHDLVAGAITREDAARQAAAEHADAYAGKLLGIEAERQKALATAKANDKDGTFEVGGRAAINSEYDAKRATTQGQADRAAKQDQWAIDQATAFGTARLALDQWTARVTDSGEVITKLFMGGLDRTNEAIVQELTERHTRGQHIFGQAGHQIATETTGSLLKGAEGQALKALGFGGGKAPKGTAGDPLYVKMANEVAGGAKEAAGSLGGWLGKAASFLHISLPAFADGVTNFGGGMALVGERGPELVSLGKGANVTPNHELAGMFSSGEGDTHHYHIDARGATDPAQVRAQVRAGIAEAMPSIHRSTRAYGKEQDARKVGR